MSCNSTHDVLPIESNTLALVLQHGTFIPTCRGLIVVGASILRRAGVNPTARRTLTFAMDTNKVRLVLALALTVSCWLQTPTAARAETSSPYSGRVCVPMPAMQAFQRAFASDPALLRGLIAGDAKIAVAERTPAPSSCAIVPSKEKIASVGSIQAAYVAAFGIVQSYRKSHVWPLGPVSLDPPRVDIVVMHYRQYVIVTLGNRFPRRDAKGTPLLLSCQGVEYYRVDLRQGAALPFDGCIEGHTPGLLPRLTQLPSPAL